MDETKRQNIEQDGIAAEEKMVNDAFQALIDSYEARYGSLGVQTTFA